MRHLALAATGAAALALAGCQQAGDDQATSSDIATEVAVSEPSTDISATPAAEPIVTDTVGVSEGGIPVALQGKWGMVPADCTSTRGDAKGLLRISATTLTFYESVGKLGAIKDRSDASIRADFAFTGEGMTWTRDETLTVSNDGRTLTRTERGGEEPGGPFAYQKCAA